MGREARLASPRSSIHLCEPHGQNATGTARRTAADDRAPAVAAAAFRLRHLPGHLFGLSVFYQRGTDRRGRACTPLRGLAQLHAPLQRLQVLERPVRHLRLRAGIGDHRPVRARPRLGSGAAPPACLPHLVLVDHPAAERGAGSRGRLHVDFHAGRRRSCHAQPHRLLLRPADRRLAAGVPADHDHRGQHLARHRHRDDPADRRSQHRSAGDLRGGPHGWCHPDRRCSAASPCR